MTDLTDVQSHRAASVALSAEEIAALPWDPSEWGGVTRHLWEDRQTGSVAGVLALSPGEAHTRHVHRAMTHHVWILSGSLSVGNELLGRGAYTCTAAGSQHGPESAGPEGCQLFYVLVPVHTGSGR